MRKLFQLFLVIAFAINSYASPFLRLTKEFRRNKFAKSEFYNELKKIKLFQLTIHTIEKPEFKHSKAFGFKPEIYIPADKRHQGLSRFDQIPPTDRRKGDPDRYRAVNPKYVKRENGRYYFALNVKAGTHYYDENLTDKGILPEMNVEIDLTQAKSGKTIDAKTEKYVYVKNKGYVLASALTQTPNEIKAGRWFQFPIKAGDHQLYDGTQSNKISASSLNDRRLEGQPTQSSGFLLLEQMTQLSSVLQTSALAATVMRLLSRSLVQPKDSRCFFAG
jgi:hypothetical protein